MVLIIQHTANKNFQIDLPLKISYRVIVLGGYAQKDKKT